jgi:hypothetical protein
MATAEEDELETLDVGDEGEGENYAEGEEEGDDDVSSFAPLSAVCNDSVSD